MVKFNIEDTGKDRIQSLTFDRRYPEMNATAIGLLEFDFKLREGSASTATAIYFPLELAWATTAHKIKVTQLKSQIH